MAVSDMMINLHRGGGKVAFIVYLQWMFLTSGFKEQSPDHLEDYV